MSTSAPVERSTRPLSEVARHLVLPSGIVDSLWFDVEERCTEFGETFDAWQDGLGQVALGLRADGMFAATIGGVTLSIPRQVAKTFIVMLIVVALCTLFPNLTVIWTAHRLRTATNTFQKMKAFCLRPTVRPYIRAGTNQGTAIRDANGEQEIPFVNGSRILFGAREQGFGRGFDEVDIEVFDEAQILTERALEDMVAATNQSRFEHGALLFYMGTPPRPVDPGEVFGARRSKALKVEELREAGDDVEFDALYVECSADPTVARKNPNDRDQWAVANPSYPHRTPLVSMLRLRENLPDDDSWLREALGVWDDEDTSPNPLASWPELADADSLPDTGIRLALDATPSLDAAAFSIAGHRTDGLLHVSVRRNVPKVERDDDRPLKTRVVELAKALTEGHDTPLIIPTGSPALAWKVELVAAGVEIDDMSTPEFAQAFGEMSSAVKDGRLRHRDQPEMNKAVEVLVTRPSGDVDVPSRRKSHGNVAPFMAACAALARVPTSNAPKYEGPLVAFR